jgi:hypothetical protein
MYGMIRYKVPRYTVQNQTLTHSIITHRNYTVKCRLIACVSSDVLSQKLTYSHNIIWIVLPTRPVHDGLTTSAIATVIKGTLIAIGYDNVEPQATPTVWNLRVLFTVGIVLASVACVSSLLLLSMSLNSWQEGSVYQRIGLGGISYGQVDKSYYMISCIELLVLN